MSKYTVHNTFSDTTVSTHRTLEAAAKAERKFQRAVKRSNGSGSYIPTQIRKNGEPLWSDIDLDSLAQIQSAL